MAYLRRKPNLVEPAQITAFLVASITLTLLPGPDILYVIAESMTRTARAGVAIATGLVSGLVVHTAAAATGASLLLMRYDAAFLILKYGGALYLLYLAVGAIREKPMSPGTSGEGIKPLAYYRKGVLMNLLNPKVSLFFLAFLPQFTSRNGLPVALQMTVLGALFIVQAWLVFALVAWLAGRLSPLLNKPGFWKGAKWFKALALAALAVAVGWPVV